jgi:hypothetical protein
MSQVFGAAFKTAGPAAGGASKHSD